MQGIKWVYFISRILLSTFLLRASLYWFEVGEPSTGVPLAGVYTPYPLAPGGGEKVTLFMIKALQSMNYEIVLFIEENKICTSIQCIRETAEILRVNGLDYSKITIKVGARRGSTLNTAEKFEVFWSIGNEKIPTVRGIGSKYNMYTCQFPFDGYKKVRERDIRILASYDSIFVYSEYVFTWYSKVIMSSILELNRRQLWNPTIDIVYPPSIDSSFSSPNKELLLLAKSAEDTVHIALLGRFFQGRQSKGQEFAISAFLEILKRTTLPLHLHLIGNIQSTFEKFADTLQKIATDLPVSFHFKISHEEVDKILSKSHIYWHMTGIAQPKEGEDAASLEHFGISIVEAMKFGCIPIVLRRGGPANIVTDGINGYLVDDQQGFIDKSLDIISNYKTRRILQLSQNAMQSVDRFNNTNFLETVTNTVTKGVKLSKLKNLYIKESKEYIRPVISPSLMSNRTAVIIDGSINSILPYTIRNTLEKLGTEWSLRVHHSVHNAQFLKQSLEDVPNIHYILEKDLFPNQKRNYNQILKSSKFWSNIKSNTALLFQADSILLSRSIHAYLKYDFIGAPVYLDGGISMSGGFSVRNVRLMEKIATKYNAATVPSDDESESRFFLRYLAREKCVLPNYTVVYEFCRQSPIPELDRTTSVKVPLALNEAWRHFDADAIMTYMQATESSVQF